MESFKGLAHIGILTGNRQEAKSFYMDNFGFKLVSETKLDKPNNAWVELSFLALNDLIVELVEPSDKEALPKGGSGSINHLAIRVENLSKIVKELKEKGIDTFETEEPIFVEKLLNGSKVIFLQGPSGERLELFEFLT